MFLTFVRSFENLPDQACQDEEEWLIQVEALSYLILWDYDFDDEDLYIDMPPEDSSRLKDYMRIKDDYFLDIPDDLNEKEIAGALSELKVLCRAVCEKLDTDK